MILLKLKIALPMRLNDNKKRYQCSSMLIQKLLALDVLPVLIFPGMDISAVVSECDGCIISGGDDVDPVLYGQRTQPQTVCEDSAIEALDIACIRQCEKQHKPLFCLCRGIQILAVVYGAPLVQHIDRHMNTAHSLRLLPYSFLHHCSQTKVNSYHHQALACCPQGFRISALSEDGVIEAIEKERVFAVQWHPELMENDECLRFFTKYILTEKEHQNQDRSPS